MHPAKCVQLRRLRMESWVHEGRGLHRVRDEVAAGVQAALGVDDVEGGQLGGVGGAQVERERRGQDAVGGVGAHGQHVQLAGRRHG